MDISSKNLCGCDWLLSDSKITLSGGGTKCDRNTSIAIGKAFVILSFTRVGLWSDGLIATWASMPELMSSLEIDFLDISTISEETVETEDTETGEIVTVARNLAAEVPRMNTTEIAEITILAEVAKVTDTTLG